MTRSARLLLFAVTMVVAPSVVQAGSDGPYRAKTTSRHAKSSVSPPASTGGINTPSTDFSKIDRADDDASGVKGGSMRPMLGSGGHLGFGTGF